MPDIGAVLGDRYRLVELLGQGGMATVYRARDSKLERDVAIKVLRPEYGTDPDFLARFRLEAQAAASLRHPGIVAVYDYGTDAIGPYIVMELVDGEDLASLLRRRGPLPPTRAAALVAQAARALDAAHQRGLVHRDVKPGNILVTADDRVQVADFGIALVLAESAMTMPGTTMGSVHYFSPEQARGEPATPASDIYGLGIVLYELLTGKRLWTGDSAAAVATARLSSPAPSPSAIRPDIPPELEAITRKALAPEPDDRFSSAKAMAEALEGFVGDESRLSGLAAAGTASAAAVAAAGAGRAISDGAPTMAAGIARPNPNASVPYPPEAFAGVDDQAGRGAVGRRTVTEEEFEDDDGGGPSRWIWASALLALAILALAGFLVFRFLSVTSAPTPTGQVVVPNLVGKTFAEAQALAQAVGLTVEQAAVETSDQPIGTITNQDPIAAANVIPGTAIKVTIAIGSATTIVPDLRALPEQQALNLIAQAGLQIGTRTEGFDLIVPAGAIVSQDPGPGAPVAKNTAVNYVVSKGPEPSPSTSPTPTPSPTPAPTPTPTLPPPPPPKPTPTQAPPPTAPPPTAPPPTPTPSPTP